MPAEFPRWNDNEIDLLKKLVGNTALLADAEAGDVASIIAGAGISVNSPTGVVTITNTGVLSVTGTANEITASPTTGAVIVSLPNALTFTGKTVTGGTFNSITVNGASTFSGLTATRVVFAGAGGTLTDDADMTFVTDTLTVTKAIHPTSVLIGNGTAANLLSALTVYDTATTLPRGISNVQVSSGTDSANFSGYKARGVPGTLTTIVTGDILANFRSWGYDGTAYINTGSIRSTSSGTIATNRVPSQLEFYTSTNASPSVLTLALTLNSSQNATFAGNIVASAGNFTSTIDASNAITVIRNGIALTPTDGVAVTNNTAATGGTTIQMSPRFRLRGNAWDTAASQTVDFYIENLPVTAATPSGILKFGYSLNGGAVTYPMTLTSAGNLAPIGHILLGGVTDEAAGGKLQFATGASDRTSGITFNGGGTDLYSTTVGGLSVNRNSVGATSINLRGVGSLFATFSADGSNTNLSSINTVALNLQTNSTTVVTVAGDATKVTIAGTKTLNFGDTANASVGVSANTTAGVLTFTAPSSGSFSFDKLATFSNGITLGSDFYIVWSGRANISAPASNVLVFDGTSAGTIITKFGGVTSGFPALKRVTTELEARLADDSGYTYIKAKLRGSNGTAGANFGPGAVTSLTVVDGVVTAVS